MSWKIKPVDMATAGVDFTRKNTTSGVIHTINPARNSIIPLSLSDARGIIISMENLSETTGEIRGHSLETDLQFQTVVGPNGMINLQIPFAEDWVLSTTKVFKISTVSTTHFFAQANEYDLVPRARNLYKITSSAELKEDRSNKYSGVGLTNIAVPHLAKDDIVQIVSTGTDHVWRFNQLRFRARNVFEYWIPGKELPAVVALGGEILYSFSLATYRKIKINPAYVAPEAALWSMENEYGD